MFLNTQPQAVSDMKGNCIKSQNKSSNSVKMQVESQLAEGVRSCQSLWKEVKRASIVHMNKYRKRTVHLKRAVNTFLINGLACCCISGLLH